MRETRALFKDGVYVRLHTTQPNLAFTSWPLLGAAKHKPFQRAGLDPLEPGEVWFLFGDDAAAIIDALVTEVKSAASEGQP